MHLCDLLDLTLFKALLAMATVVPDSAEKRLLQDPLSASFLPQASLSCVLGSSWMEASAEERSHIH